MIFIFITKKMLKKYCVSVLRLAKQ